MAYIENPDNYDIEDDAVFAGLLMQGLVWIEDDDEDGSDADIAREVAEEAWDFVYAQKEIWVNFSRLSTHLYETFGKLDLKRLGDPDKKYKNLIQFFADYPDVFELRLDPQKSGLYWIRAKEIS